MNKKWIMWSGVVLVVLVTAGIIFLKPVSREYSPDPATWIESNGGVSSIDVSRATRGKGYLDTNGLQYETDEIGTVFTLEGWYGGEYFKNEYVDENGRVLMRITEHMKPGDGIPEGFILEKIENNKPTIHIFLDNDWRKKIAKTAIYWGVAYENEEPFDFSEDIRGIYHNTVEDDAERFQNNFNLHSGGVWVGNLKEDETSTIISLS
tara:strand:+ start:1116 stop:1736 length:621 start_codon:yes stop_codon:yes gene_type:complete